MAITQAGSASPIYFTRDPNGNPISMRVGAGGSSSNSYYLLDQQGSVLRLTDATGNTDTATYTYDPYGTTLTATGTQATLNPYRYGTGYYDSSTGILKLGQRYDSTALGRFSQTDSLTSGIANSSAVNKYPYAGDDPTAYTDPSGQSFWGNVVKGIGIAASAGAIFATGDLAVAAFTGVAVASDIGSGVLNGDSKAEIGIGAGLDAVSGGVGYGLEKAGVEGSRLTAANTTYFTGSLGYNLGTSFNDEDE